MAYQVKSHQCKLSISGLCCELSGGCLPINLQQESSVRGPLSAGHVTRGDAWFSKGNTFRILKRSYCTDGSCPSLAVAESRPASWIPYCCLGAHGLGLRLNEIDGREE